MTLRDIAARARKGLSHRWRMTLVALVVGVAVVGVTSWRANVYLTRSKSFCLSCHDTAEADLSSSSHASLDCGECHRSTFGQNFALWVKKAAEGTKANGPHAVADRARCNVCHLAGSEADKQINTTVGHESHVLRGPKSDCTVCHGSNSHKLTPKPDVCRTCHQDVKIFHAGTNDLSCVSCHNFLAKTSSSRKPASTDCQRCHGGKVSADRSGRFAEVRVGPEVSSAMVHGNLEACRMCHNPHEPDPEKRTTGQACERCHQGASKTVAELEQPAHKRCTSCHEVHAVRAEVGNACARCHEDARPRVGPPPNDAAKHAGCTTCHPPHTFSSKGVDCGACHEANAKKLASFAAGSGHGTCQNCHAPHVAGAEHQACASCHRPMAGHGHGRCTTCHAAHGTRAETATCQGCHGKELGALSSVAGHGTGCATCHPTHAVSGASGRCGQCHEEQSKKAAGAGIGAHGTCASCHAPHGFASSQAACNRCHTMAGGAHKGACKDCHASHGSPRTAKDSCRKCHPGASGSPGKHEDCRSCHKPHQAASEVGTCASCHAAQAGTVHAWSAAEHKNCATCHPAHNPNATPACASCHSGVAAEASGSKHSCEQCHHPHQAPGGWWNRCSTCHGAIAAAVKGRGPHHAKCESCHKPHRFGRPSCTSCHNAMASLGSHGKSGHKNCTACHDTHGSRAVTRSTCMTCHQDRKDHHPDAKTCTSCHLFR